MIPFPLPIAKPANEDQRLYAQAYRCLMAASWQRAIPPFGAEYAEELIEGATVYLQLRAELRTPV